MEISEIKFVQSSEMGIQEFSIERGNNRQRSASNFLQHRKVRLD